MKGIHYKLLLPILVILTCCLKPVMTNPFDPECPKDLFTPTDFTATQSGDSVVLNWHQPNDQITGFVLQRKSAGSGYSDISKPDKTKVTAVDKDLTGGVKYEYQLYAYAGNNKSNTPTTEVTPLLAPSVTTTSITDITTISAITGGNVIAGGGTTVTVRGVCWSTSLNPTTASSKTADGTDTGSFTSSMTGLSWNTTYFVRAYATNSTGTGYGNNVSFKTLDAICFNPNLTYGTMTDIEGNVYKTITIGTQTWMAENLKTTKYRNGDPIPNAIEPAWSYLGSGAYCWYNNDVANKDTYGALYNWYAGTDSRNIAPIGWHVPTDAEWTTLITFLGGESFAGGKLKEACTTHWTSPNTGATNESGFTGIPSGERYGGDYNLGNYGRYWSSASSGSNQSWIRYLKYNSSSVTGGNGWYQHGCAIRLVKDSPVVVPTLSTTAVTAISQTTATSGGNVTSDGGATVTARGVCWGTSANPTTASSKTTDLTGTGIFTSNLTGMTASTTYYLRAYATNSAGPGYGNEVSFKTSSPSSGTVTDQDGNVYDYITIGTQVWMVQNLKTTKYRNGDPIPYILDSAKWVGLTSGAYTCYNSCTNGHLYNWYTVADSRILAPIGWHVATDEEWTVLTNYLGDKAANKLKEVGSSHWVGNNIDTTNETGFTAIPSGWYYGAFNQINDWGLWWTSTANDPLTAFYRDMSSQKNSVDRNYRSKYCGKSVRCLRD